MVDTMNVETEEEFADGGCETCDYGSKYGFVLRVSPGDPFQQLKQSERSADELTTRRTKSYMKMHQK